jgi:hypothetical protein
MCICPGILVREKGAERRTMHDFAEINRRADSCNELYKNMINLAGHDCMAMASSRNDVRPCFTILIPVH